MKKVVMGIIVLMLLFPASVFAGKGCCSSHGGVSGACRNGYQVCNDGTTSPSCTCSGGSTSSTSSSSSSNSPTPSYVYGCTDENAVNYNPKANKDDGSCIAKVLGCMDKMAQNYNSNANVEDNSCKYEKEIKESEAIKHDTEYISNNELESGKEKVKTKGIDGEKEITYIVLVDADGNEISREKKNETVVKEPIAEIVEKGTRQEISPVIGMFWIISLALAFYYAFKHKEGNLLLNKIQKQKQPTNYILYILYIITVIPPFIDVILIINNKYKKSKK